MSEDKATLACHLRPEEQSRVRRCSECSGDMKPADCHLESDSFLFHDRLLRFHCQDCDRDLSLFSGESISLRILMVSVILAGGIALVVEGGLRWIFSLLSELSLFIVPGILLLALVLIIAMHAFSTALELFDELRFRLKNPRVTGCSGVKRLAKTLLLGLLPWVLALTIGYYDYYVKDLDETVALLLLPLVFAPVFFAHRLGLSSLGTFLATLFWLPVVYLLVYQLG